MQDEMAVKAGEGWGSGKGKFSERAELEMMRMQAFIKL